MYVCNVCMYVCNVCMYVCNVCMYVCLCVYVCMYVYNLHEHPIFVVSRPRQESSFSMESDPF
jgi:hypothetical protein